jgi:hypothetical protein
MNDEIAGVDTLALPPLTRPVLQLLFLLVNNIFTHYLSQCCGSKSGRVGIISPDPSRDRHPGPAGRSGSGSVSILTNMLSKVVMSTISKRKQKRSNIEAYYRNESRIFWFGPLKIGTEAERFGLVRIFVCQKQFVSFWPIGSGTKRTNLIWSRNCLRRSGTFLCNKKTYRSKQKVLIWFPYYGNESKTFWIGLLVFRTEAKYFHWVCLLSELKQNVLIWSAYYLN